MVLLVGLATYSRIETAIAGNTQRQAQARQNALFAVNVAVAQLQKYAGPDARVTTTAGAFLSAPNAQKKYYMGVWDTTQPVGTAPVWLASGLETGTSPDVTVATAAANRIALVGTNTDGSAAANNVVADLQNLRAPGVPGQTGNNTIIGKYAWWVGDNGVKADIARADITSKLNYPPFTDQGGTAVSEMRTRLLQQTGLGAGAFDTATSTASFDPRDTTNATLAANTLSTQQVPFLRTPGNTALGLAPLKSHYHSWTVGNHNVLARTNAAPSEVSLRNDLSTNPDVLGGAFRAWADYPSYMESPDVNPLASALTPPATALRRRYRITPLTSISESDNGAQFGVVPVLTYFALTFSFHNSTQSLVPEPDNHLEGSMRCVASFWNPYTGALVPEDLEIRVLGLPEIGIGDFDRATPAVNIDVPNFFGDASLIDATNPAAPTVAPIRFLLPKSSVTGGDDQNTSWLPGRVYSWSAADNTEPSASGTNPMIFGQRDLLTTPLGGGVVRKLDGLPALSTLASDGRTLIRRRTYATTSTVLTIELRRASDGVLLATFKSPTYRPFSTDDSVTVTTNSRNLDFAYVFRFIDPVKDGTEGEAWLQTTGVDVRSPQASAQSLYVVPSGADDPAGYVVDSSATPLTTKATLKLGDASLLLDRDPGTPFQPTGLNFNEDVPVFELPRSPLLSVAQLQHLSIPGLRPFWVGNSAAARGSTLWNNALFDQQFFTGLGSGSSWSDPAAPLPNTLLRVLRTRPDGTRVIAGDFFPKSTTTVDPADPTATPITTTTGAGLGAKYALQGGAFNLNSTDPDAWAAVLRSVRFPTGREFQYLNTNTDTGTAPDGDTLSLSAEAAFPRFSQSAQETYKVTPGYPHTDTNSLTSFTVHTEYYRQGFRTLDAATVSSLAQKIATAVETHIRASGPYRSVQEFLDPITTVVPDPNDPTLTLTTVGPSLLEQAIIDLQLNLDPNVPLDPITSLGTNYPMSSIYLTQADIMTALAPVLFTRSDTFTVRAYGEASNPLTGAAEGKAWCEAIVQRLPEPFAPATPNAPTDDEYKTPPGELGRRFKIISLRWLTRSDI